MMVVGGTEKSCGAICADLIGHSTVKGKDGTVIDVMCLAMIDPATAWFQMVALPTIITKNVLGKSSTLVRCRIRHLSK